MVWSCQIMLLDLILMTFVSIIILNGIILLEFH